MANLIFALIIMVVMSAVGGAIILLSDGENNYINFREEEDKWETK